MIKSTRNKLTIIENFAGDCHNLLNLKNEPRKSCVPFANSAFSDSESNFNLIEP